MKKRGLVELIKQEIFDQDCDCPVCESSNHENWLICDDGQMLNSCKDCGLGFLAPYPTKIDSIYQNYGDHLTKLPAKYFESRLKKALRNPSSFHLLKRPLAKTLIC